MANIQNVDYEAIPGRAKEIRSEGEQLNSELLTVYQSVAQMHASWYGQRYNSLVKLFNELIPNLNSLLDLVVGEIPYALETVANNYAQADRGSNVTSASRDMARKVQDIQLSNEVGMKFITTEVEHVHSDVVKRFDTAQKIMDSIKTTYSSIEWNSEAGEAFSAKFENARAEIVAAFDAILSAFDSLMKAAIDQVEQAEKSNEVNV